MNTHAILAKAALNHEQIKTKINIGCDGIEIQLLDEMLDKNDSRSWLDVHNVFNLEEFKTYPIKVIHTPIIKGKDDVLLEHITNVRDYKIIYNSFDIANYFGKIQNIKVGVVCHSETNKKQLENIGNIWEELKKRVNELLLQFPYTELLIENMVPLRDIENCPIIELSNNYLFDNVEMVQSLRSNLKTDRIGTVFDTCHQMITKKYVDVLYDAIGDIRKPDISMETYLRKNSPYIKIIHIADMNGSGYGRGKHGIAFDESTYWKLKNILQLVDRYAKNCTLTLEVAENSYKNPTGYITTKHLVDQYYQQNI